jgi:hypothetical protein
MKMGQQCIKTITIEREEQTHRRWAFIYNTQAKVVLIQTTILQF